MISSEQDFYSRGLAIGGIDLGKNAAFFRFRNEDYELPVFKFWAHMVYVKRWPAMKIEIVRAVGKRI